MPIITLTTDFGTSDGYVGAMKGVIARAAERAAANPIHVVDIAHDIPPGDTAHAAWVLATAGPHFPYGTIHVVVVDPGVGSARRGVIVDASQYLYVGPDNGVFAYVTHPSHATREITSKPFRASRVSPTFHGRDIFAPAAAALALGHDMTLAGPVVARTGALPWGIREVGEGRVVHIDRFGNLITDLPASEAGPAVAIGPQVLPVRTTYADAAVGELLAYVGSAGTIELAVRDGRADQRLGVDRGARVLPAGSGGPFR